LILWLLVFRDATVHHATQSGKFVDESFAEYIRRSADNFLERVSSQISDLDSNSQASMGLFFILEKNNFFYFKITFVLFFELKKIGSYIDQIYQDFLVQLNTRYPNYDKVLVNSMVQSIIQDQKVDYAIDR
jgi:hypothetical protein